CSFPQNSTLDGTAIFPSLQLDEVAFPLILAWQLGRADPTTYRTHLKRAADFLVANGPATPQERWEEASGYSPATIAAEIAGLVCAADIARRNGDAASSLVYLGFADRWRRSVDRWTYTTSGPLPPHYERIDQDGKANTAVPLTIANGGGSYDERTIVDPSFLELVRLGVKPPEDERVAQSVDLVDSTILVRTPNGPGFHRYSHDGYGETADGSPYTGAGIGRLWPLLTGERGEYELANGREALSYLRAMAGFANEGYLIPEQVWDRRSGPFPFGEGTGSATPLVPDAEGRSGCARGRRRRREGRLDDAEAGCRAARLAGPSATLRRGCFAAPSSPSSPPARSPRRPPARRSAARPGCPGSCMPSRPS